MVSHIEIHYLHTQIIMPMVIISRMTSIKKDKQILEPHHVDGSQPLQGGKSQRRKKATAEDVVFESFTDFDVLADLKQLECSVTHPEKSKISLRITNRNAKKCVTSIIGLQVASEDMKAICKELKKKFHCRGSISEDEVYGTVVDLTGDQRAGVVKHLVDHGICKIDDIVV